MAECVTTSASKPVKLKRQGKADVMVFETTSGGASHGPLTFKPVTFMALIHVSNAKSNEKKNKNTKNVVRNHAHATVLGSMAL